MFKIEKAPETMSAKERVRRTFAYEKTDRVPIGIDLNPVIRKNLFQDFQRYLVWLISGVCSTCMYNR